MGKLYDDVVMEHIRNARNFGVPDAHDATSNLTNPLCGDEVSVYLGIAAGRIARAAFHCSCCGISMASASMMTERVTGLALDEARALATDLVARIDAAPPGEADVAPGAPLEEVIVATASAFPARRGCAALAWRTLLQALPEA